MDGSFSGSEIALIGLAGRFPGARNTDQLWRNLRQGIESISFFTDQQLELLGVDQVKLRQPDYVKAAGVLEDVELFDASFFGVNPREAEIMDPQHRVLLECAWEALENAGYDPETYKGAIGIYAGATMNTYLLLNLIANPQIINSFDDLQLNIGNGGDFLTTRVSYKLNLRGPSHLVQSACSTSLVAVHIACQSLLNGECDMALAGGVSINTKLRTGYRYVAGGMTSPDGHCRAFDAKAQGTIFSSGVGLVVLKRAEDALAERDHIYALIKGSAINNDGSLKVGYTAPSVDGQASVVVEALANAGVGAETITYVETHGTGTPLGDPIEIQALTKAFRASADRRRFCAIGSVKTNFGHLDAAAGVAGLIKTALALKHKLLPASLHFHEPNPKIDFENSPFYVNTQLSYWEAGPTPRRAGVSAFGVGGTNAHVILEEAPDLTPTRSQRGWRLVTVSAKTRRALEQGSRNLAAYLREHEGESLADMAYTLQVGRKGFNHRRVVVCQDSLEAARWLECEEGEGWDSEVKQGGDRPVVFMFPGQGAQYVNMALDLYRDESVFRREVDLCSTLLEPHLGLDLRSVLYPRSEALDDAARQLERTRLAQPALFVIEYALAKLWLSWGVRLQAMIGHSIGEYVAACLAEVFSLEDGLALISTRGRMIDALPPGRMLAVSLPEPDLRALLTEELDLAAINGVNQCVVSGISRAIEELEKRLAENSVAYRLLRTSHAFHSQMIDPILETFTQQVKRIKLKSPTVPYISNVTGEWITERDAMDPAYWMKQLRQTVRFADGLSQLSGETECILLEVGPGRSLSKLAKRHPDIRRQSAALSSLPDNRDGQSDYVFMLGALGKLWLSGVRVDWNEFHRGEQRARLPLPTYPFERQRYWIEPGMKSASGESANQMFVGREEAPAKNDHSTGGALSSWVAPFKDADNLQSNYPEPISQKTSVFSSGDIEQRIAEIWKEALGVRELSIDDNFFDLGGDSLAAIRVASLIKSELGIEAPVVSLYEGLTIRSLAQILGRDQNADEAGQQDIAQDARRTAKIARRKGRRQKQRSKSEK